MTVKHIINIQKVCIENQRYITIVNPKNIVPKRITKVRNEVPGNIKDTSSVISKCPSSLQNPESKVMQTQKQSPL